ncbi:GntR family transcriptional regulator [Sphingomonas sp. WKB10]|nr:GntR family transcriptional regulator [Sphingomonas sp. WKB10]
MRDIAWTRSDEATPLYMQLAQRLREHIDGGGIDPGSALPSERELSEMAGLSRVTVRKGIKQLIDEGVVVSKHGSGTFVARRIETAGAKLNSFSDDTRSRGQDPGWSGSTNPMPWRPRRKPPCWRCRQMSASRAWAAYGWPATSRWRSNMR